MNTLVPLLIVTLIIGLISGFVIRIVGKLRLGLEVDGFGIAFLAGVIIAFLAGIMNLIFGIAGIMDGVGLIGSILHLVVSAIILMLGSKFLPGLKVNRFTGALVASIAIGAVYWLGGLLLGLLV